MGDSICPLYNNQRLPVSQAASVAECSVAGAQQGEAKTLLHLTGYQLLARQATGGPRVASELYPLP